MLNGFDKGLEDKLKQAEEAEAELLRLQPIAAEAAQLRLEKAKAHKSEERKRSREYAMQQAQRAADAASEKQSYIPELLGNAGRSITELYKVLKEIDGLRTEASQALAIADRVDYEVEVEEGQEQEEALDRDPRGLAYALAARHGEGRVKEMLDEMDPDFSLIRGGNLDEPIFRDVAKFVVDHVNAAPKVARPVPDTSGVNGISGIPHMVPAGD